MTNAAVLPATNEDVFSSKNVEIHWNIVESRQQVKDVHFSRLPERTRELINAFVVMGVMGSAQLKKIFLNNNKKNLAILKQLDILLQHTLIRNGSAIPIYTLGRTGIFLAKQLGFPMPLNYWVEYSSNKVMDCIVTYQLLGRYRLVSDTFLKDVSEFSPFKAVISAPTPNGSVDYTVGVIRDQGDINKFNSYFRLGQDIPKKIIFIVTDIQLMGDLMSIIKPFVKDIRVVEDKDLKMDCEFTKMFYRFKEDKNAWESA